MSGSSKDFFDFNHDGKLDALEWSAKMEFWDEVSKDHSSQYAGTGRAAQSPRTGSGRPRPVQKAADASSVPEAGLRAGQTVGTGQKVGASQKSEVKLDPAERFLLKMLLAIFCFMVCYYAFRGINHYRDREAELSRVKNMLEEFKNRVPEELPKYFKENGIGLNGSYTAEAFPEMTMSPGLDGKNQFYHVKIDHAVTFHADEYFDRLDDRTKYDYLEALYQKTGKIYDAFMKKSFPEIPELNKITSVEGLRYDYRGGEYEVYIETPKHLYQYSKMYNDLFILDGESYFLTDEESRWN